MKALFLFLLIFVPIRSESQKSVDSLALDLDAFARSLAGDARTDVEKAERTLKWLSSNFRWLSTDYKRRNVQEIIERQGGNCFELAVVFMDLIKRLDIKHRQIAEVNIHPVTPRRQASAEKRVEEVGFKASVFGLQHNDHRWTEIYDESTGQWIPADPSMGVIGLEQWLKARVWFGERKTIDTSITNDMLVPIGIFVVGDPARYNDDRTTYYLVNSFNELYEGRLSKLPEWKKWREGLIAIAPDIQGAFRGERNLHLQAGRIAGLWSTYLRLKKEAE